MSRRMSWRRFIGGPGLQAETGFKPPSSSLNKHGSRSSGLVPFPSSTFVIVGSLSCVVDAYQCLSTQLMPYGQAMHPRRLQSSSFSFSPSPESNYSRGTILTRPKRALSQRCLLCMSGTPVVLVYLELSAVYTHECRPLHIQMRWRIIKTAVQL
jgi:hypothetical protein